MDKNPFLHRLMDEEKSDVVHSSAFGVAQNAEGIGAASTQSFNDRIEIDKNRMVVGKYNDSKLVGETWKNKPRVRRYNANMDTEGNNTGVDAKAPIESNLDKRAKAQFKRDDDSGGMRANVSRFRGEVTKRKMTAPPIRKNPGIFR